MSDEDKTRVNIEDKLAALREDYTQKLPGKISNIDELWNKLRYFNWNDEAFHILHNFVHALSGSGKTFGFSSLSDRAHDLEIYLQDILNSKQAPDEKQQEKITQLINALHVAAKNSDTDASAIAEIQLSKDDKNIDRSEHVIYLVDDDVHTAEYLSQHLVNAGYKVNVFHKIKDIYEAIKQASPSAVIMDIMFPEGSLAGIDTVDNIRASTGTRTPILFMSARADVTARLRVVRAGGDAYFTKPVNLNALINKLDDITLPCLREGHRVLLIEDDVDLAEYYEIVLKEAGFVTQVVNKPMKTIQVIQEFVPDLLLMDMNMPEINGLELASVIRQEEQFIGLPIVFVTAETDPELKARAKSLGGEKFLTKPVDDATLVEVVHRSILKSRRLANTLKQVSRNDRTGMINRKSFLADLERVIATTNNNETCNALLYITIDYFDVIRKQIGLIGLDPLANELGQRIQLSLQANDQVSQISEAVFAVLASTDDQTSMKQLANSIHKSISQTNISIDKNKLDIKSSVGISFISNTTLNINELLAQAEEAAINASKQGGNQVQEFGGQQSKESTGQTDAGLKEKIIRAIKKKSFRLVFQPILNVADEEQEFYEVLLRMVDEENKAVLPSQFFPIAEQENLLHEIDRWAIENAITILSDNIRVRMRGTFFVKVSGESISRDSFTTWICNCLSNSRLRGEQKVVFEMRENDVVTRLDDVLKFSKSLKTMSCGFAIEHYGISNKNHSLLDDLDVDFVKVDGSTISLSEENNELQKLVNEVQSKDRNIIVGSVDNPSVLAMLWGWGVRYYQGYYIEEPHESLNFNFSQAVDEQKNELKGSE